MVDRRRQRAMSRDPALNLPPAEPHDASQVVVAVKGSPAYGARLAELTEQQRIKTAELIDPAVVQYAKCVGFDKPAPRETQQGYNDTIARLNQAEIDRLTLECDEARHRAAEAARRKEG